MTALDKAITILIAVPPVTAIITWLSGPIVGACVGFVLLLVAVVTAPTE